MRLTLNVVFGPNEKWLTELYTPEKMGSYVNKLIDNGKAIRPTRHDAYCFSKN